MKNFKFEKQWVEKAKEEGKALIAVVYRDKEGEFGFENRMEHDRARAVTALYYILNTNPELSIEEAMKVVLDNRGILLPLCGEQPEVANRGS